MLAREVARFARERRVQRYATEVPVALLTGIVGAAVGGNLTLLVLDIAWDWPRGRNRFADTKAKESLEARPATG